MKKIIIDKVDINDNNIIQTTKDKFQELKTIIFEK